MITSDLDPDLVESALFLLSNLDLDFLLNWFLAQEKNMFSTTVSPIVKVLSKKVDYAMKYLMFKH